MEVETDHRNTANKRTAFPPNLLAAHAPITCNAQKPEVMSCPSPNIKCQVPNRSINVSIGGEIFLSSNNSLHSTCTLLKITQGTWSHSANGMLFDAISAADKKFQYLTQNNSISITDYDIKHTTLLYLMLD